jgi:hypothetical protein
LTLLLTARARLLLAVLATSVGAAPPAQGADPLRWKFKPGEMLRYTMVQETVQGVKAGGQEVKTNLNQTVNMHWEVKSVSSDGVAQMSQTIDHVRMKVDGAGNSFEFDSATSKVPEGQIAGLLVPLLKALVGAEFTLKMNARGELSDVKVPQKLIDSLRQASPAATAGGMFSEDGLKNLISQSSLALPEGTLEKGKTWTNQSRLPIPMVGTMVMDKRYTFEGPDPKAAGLLQISLETKMNLEQAADSNVAVKITSHDGKGEFSFDPMAGHMVSSHVDDKMKMSVSVQGQNIEQSTDTTTRMTLAKDGANK